MLTFMIFLCGFLGGWLFFLHNSLLLNEKETNSVLYV